MQTSNNRCMMYGGIAATVAFAVTAPLVMVLTLSPSTATAAEPAVPDRFRKDVRPLLERYCVDCHGKEDSEAGIVLDRFEDQAAAVKDGRTWLRVRDAMRGAHHAAGRRCPSRRWRSGSAIVGWIENDYLAAQCGQQASSAAGRDPAAQPAGVQQHDPRPARARPAARGRLPAGRHRLRLRQRRLRAQHLARPRREVPRRRRGRPGQGDRPARRRGLPARRTDRPEDLSAPAGQAGRVRACA